jgi:hypothetical protein
MKKYLLISALSVVASGASASSFSSTSLPLTVNGNDNIHTIIFNVPDNQLNDTLQMTVIASLGHWNASQQTCEIDPASIIQQTKKQLGSDLKNGSPIYLHGDLLEKMSQQHNTQYTCANVTFKANDITNPNTKIATTVDMMQLLLNKSNNGYIGSKPESKNITL